MERYEIRTSLMESDKNNPKNEDLCYENRLKNGVKFNLWKKRLRRHMISTFRYLKVFPREVDREQVSFPYKTRTKQQVHIVLIYISFIWINIYRLYNYIIIYIYMDKLSDKIFLTEGNIYGDPGLSVPRD